MLKMKNSKDKKKEKEKKKNIKRLFLNMSKYLKKFFSSIRRGFEISMKIS